MLTRQDTLDTADRLPTPPDRPGHAWRPLRLDDMPAHFRMLLAAAAADERTHVVSTVDDMQRQFGDPWSSAETDSFAAFTPQGEIAAFTRTYMNPEPDPQGRAERRLFVDLEVHPDHRGRGLEVYLLAWAEVRGRHRLLAEPGDHVRLIRTGCQDNLAQRMALLEQNGFRPSRYFYRMRRDLNQPIPEGPLPAGLTLRTYAPQLSAQVREAVNDSFGDHWGFEPATPEDWQTFIVGASAFRPDLTFVAMQAETVAGFSINTVDAAENARQGIREGWVAELGVRRPFRKRGLATALLCATLRAFKAAGLDHATLGVDAENPTGALGLYERLGFVPVKRIIAFDKQVT